jgi:hypothetical protein
MRVNGGVQTDDTVRQLPASLAQNDVKIRKIERHEWDTDG